MHWSPALRSWCLAALVAAAPARAADADLDPGFGIGGERPLAYPLVRSDQVDRGVALLRDAQGRWLAIQSVVNPFPFTPGSDLDLVIHRYTPSGQPDLTFGGGTGYVLAPLGWVGFGKAMLDSQGRILVAGTALSAPPSTSVGLLLLRLLPNGSRDLSFTGGLGNEGVSGFAYGNGSLDNRALAVAELPNGDVVLAGNLVDANDNWFALRVAGTNGAPVGTWGSGFGLQVIDLQPAANLAQDALAGIAALADGRLVLMGHSCTAALGCRPAAARLDLAGMPDAGFCASAGCVASSVAGVNGGRRVVRDPLLAGYVLTSVEIGAATRDNFGRLLLAGRTQVGAGGPAPGLVLRLGPDGDLDASFGAVTSPGCQALALADAPVAPAALVLDPQARIVIGGSSTRAAQRRLFLARLQANGAADAGFSTTGAIAEYFPAPAAADRALVDLQAQAARITALGDGNGPANRDAFLFRVGSILYGDGFE